MSQLPGPRTHPTIKPSVIMNKKNLNRWELRLGIMQIVVMVGVVTGCMAFAFALGFFSGRSVGFESALASNISSSAKIPIAAEPNGGAAPGDAAEQAVSEVYAKLSDKTVNHEKTEESLGALPDDGVPELGSIKEADHPVALPEESDETTQDTTKALAPEVAKAAHAADEVWDRSEKNVADTEKHPTEAGVKVLGKESEAAKEAAHDSGTSDAGKFIDGDSSVTAEAPKKEAKVIESKLATDTSKTQITKPEAVKPAPEKSVEKAVVAAVAPKEKEIVKPAPVEVKPSKSDAGPEIKRGTIPPSGWFAQVAAPNKAADADSLASKLRSAGFPVVIENAQVRGEAYFRILVGPEVNRKQAEVLIGQLKRESYIQGEPFLRAVK